MRVYFSHGKESGPWGGKITRLANIAEALGFAVDSIDYSDTLDPDTRVKRLVHSLAKAEDEFLLVGSSMGGYVALVAAERVAAQGLFLLAPALFMPGYQRQTYRSSKNIEIVHGWSDEVIPPEHSIKFARASNCSLHLISGSPLKLFAGGC